MSCLAQDSTETQVRPPSCYTGWQFLVLLIFVVFCAPGFLGAWLQKAFFAQKQLALPQARLHTCLCSATPLSFYGCSITVADNPLRRKRTRSQSAGPQPPVKRAAPTPAVGLLSLVPTTSGHSLPPRPDPAAIAFEKKRLAMCAASAHQLPSSFPFKDLAMTELQNSPATDMADDSHVASSAVPAAKPMLLMKRAIIKGHPPPGSATY